MIAKFGAYLITASNFVLSDAAESIVNVIASSFAFYSIYLAARPRDENHPYGHGKVEFFSVFIEGTLICIAAIGILIKSTYNIFYPYQVHDLLTGVYIIGATGVVNGSLGFYMISKGKSLRSITIEADGRHLITDMITSIGLVAGLLLIYFTKIDILDSILSIAVGLYILFIGYKLLRKSVSGLMDETDFGVIKEVLAILNAKRRDEWIDFHNLRVQKYGHELHIDCHLTLPNYFDLNKVHEQVKSVDRIVNKEASVQTEFFIHADPCVPQCCHYCNMHNCPIRSEAKNTDITWTMENVTRNKKHFEQ